MTTPELNMVAILARPSMRFGRNNQAPRFINQLVQLPAHATLTPNQREYLWTLAKRHGRQYDPKDELTALAFLDAVTEWKNAPAPQQPFERTLCHDPADAHCRLIYSDWLEEHQHLDLATTQRWMVQHSKYPELRLIHQTHSWEWRLSGDPGPYTTASNTRLGNPPCTSRITLELLLNKSLKTYNSWPS